MHYFIITYGCQMNKSDSERIAAVLENIGIKSALNINRADLIVVNMCSVRQSAVDRVYGLIPKFDKLKKKKSGLKTLLTGCILAQDKKKLKGKFDLIFNIKELPNLSKLLFVKSGISLRSQLYSASRYDSYLKIPPLYSSLFSAYVPIMTGCNNFCSYCVVPYVRGREFCRPVKEIIQEVKHLVKNGYKEIILLGQNVNSYSWNMKHGTWNRINFPKLLKMVNDIPGKFWIRFITSHPKDLSDELVDTMANCEKVCEYLHLPIQSGDNQILKKMNRGYTRQHYQKLIDKIRQKIKNISISTDIIVGFPSETEKQFENTAKLMRWARFDMAYIARYSPRTGTRATKMKDNVSGVEKKWREKILTEIFAKTALKNNKKYIGKTIQILLETKRNEYFYGKTRTFKNVRITTNYESDTNIQIKTGEFCKVKIISATPWGLAGEFSQAP